MGSATESPATPREVPSSNESATQGSSPKVSGGFAGDFIASLVVFLVALPLCMGIAIASGVPPALGLATGVIGGIIVGTFSGSPLQVSGPAAGLSVVVFELVREHGIELLGPVLLLAGLIQFVAGRLKLGQWFRAISPAVVYGMLAGIGLLIIAAQFHVMLDGKPKASGLENLVAIPGAVLAALFPQSGSNGHLAAATGIFTLAVILLWNRFRPNHLRVVPGTLIGVIAGTLLAFALDLPIKRVSIPDNIFSALTLPTTNSLGRLLDPSVLITTVALAFIASAETLLSAAAVDRMHSGPRAQFDKELSAQGLGNFLCGAIGALPMTGVIVRSSANVQAGARTRLSAILHGIWLLAFILLFPSILRMIPTASLAAILVFTGFKLVEVQHVRKLFEYGRMPVFIYAATVVGIVSVDLLTGVLIGLALSVVKLIHKATHLEVRVSETSERRVDVHLEGVASFVRLPKLTAALDGIGPDRIIHLHVQNLHHIDHTCLDFLKSVSEQRAQSGGSLEVHWSELERRYRVLEVGRGDLRRPA